MILRDSKLVLCVLFLAGITACDEPQTGPVEVSAIGPPPRLVNPNLEPLPPPSALLLQATAQGLVRFDSAGEIEPALAQSWIVSDDGLRYTFRLRRIDWPDGGRVTADEVAARLRAAVSRASRNPLKPVLGAVTDIVAMTDEVLEISLSGPRPNFLQLLAQPQMGIILNGRGTGPYIVSHADSAGTLLVLRSTESEEDPEEDPGPIGLLLRGEPAATAIARFAQQDSDAILGGTIGDLPLVRAADLPAARLQFDPVSGLLGLEFKTVEGPLGNAEIRQALSMAIDRQALASALGAPGLAARTALVPPGTVELASPSQPAWTTSPLPMRRELASRRIADLDLEEPLHLRVAMPDSPGYRILFAHVRHDWRLIGVEAERVRADAPAELSLVDRVAPSVLATWYLRHFTCEFSPVCDPAADLALEAARTALAPAERRTQLATADGILAGLAPFIPLTTPVRWSLVSSRLTGFRTNQFGRHPLGELIAESE
ncbi:MAG TPA: ABC transporter substrate-binding protein [Allosphingosinicella sp.]|nr:ABC transporter substrate-binding protein [Allosphingosinicella sp.]